MIAVDGVEYHVKDTIRDDYDHTIYLLAGPAFMDIAPIGGSGHVGESIFIVGNPNGLQHIFRRGSVAGYMPVSFWEGEDGDGMVLYDINGFFGDSGAAVFDESGNIIGVISLLHIENKNDESSSPEFRLFGGFPLSFTPGQLAEARNFVPKD